MESVIERFKFVLDQDTNTISVLENSEPVSTIIPDKEIGSKKDFDMECSYWYFEHGR